MRILVLLMILIFTMAFSSLSQESSPAGGRWLELDGKSSLTVEGSRFLFNAIKKEVTIEAWIYLLRPPAITSLTPQSWRIVGFRKSFEMVLSYRPTRKLILLVPLLYEEENIASLAISWINEDKGLGKWIHVAAFYETPGVFGSHLNGRSGVDGESPIIQLRQSEKMDFIIGENMDCLIDELRISCIRRYKNDFVPPSGKFIPDKDTVALWHFDTAKGSGRDIKILDSSDNGYDLVVLEGEPHLGMSLSVPSKGKLTTSWGKVRSEY